VHTGFWWGHLRERDHSEDLGGYNIQMDLQEIGGDGVDWIHLFEKREREREKWRAFLNTVMNSRVS
jgi:hypothetical protein